MSFCFPSFDRRRSLFSTLSLDPNNLIDSFRGRPKSDDDFLVDAGVGPGSKIAAAETAEWRRSRGADAALAREEERASAEAAGSRRQEAPVRSPPTSSPPEKGPENDNTSAGNAGNATAAAPPPPPSCSTTDPAARQLDALEATIKTLEEEAAAAGLFSQTAASDDAAAPRTTTTPTRGGLFSRHRRQQEEKREEPPSGSDRDRAALHKEALRLSEFSTQQLLKLDAVELPHLSDEGEQDRSAAATLARERISALRARRKGLIKRAQALGDAMDRAKERLK